MREIKLLNNNFNLKEPILGYYSKTVTKFGTGAKIDCSRDYMDRRVIVIILKRK